MLNYRDTIVANNTYPFPVKENLVPCSDGVGVVIAIGSGVIARGGMIAVIGFLSPAKQEDMPDAAGLVLSKECFVRGIAVGSQQLVRYVSSKNIQPCVQNTFGFTKDEIFAAFDYLQTGSHIVKVGIEIEH